MNISQATPQLETKPKNQPLVNIEGVFYRLHNGVVQYRNKHTWKECMRQDWNYYLTKGKIVCDATELRTLNT